MWLFICTGNELPHALTKESWGKGSWKKHCMLLSLSKILLKKNNSLFLLLVERNWELLNVQCFVFWNDFLTYISLLQQHIELAICHHYHYNTWLKLLGLFSALTVWTLFLQVIATGRWLKLEKTTYVDPAGNSRHATFSVRWPFIFSAKSRLTFYLLQNQTVGDCKEDNEASQRGIWRWAPGLWTLVSGSSARRQLFTHIVCRCRNHRPTETDPPQGLRGNGEAVSPTYGMLHSGVSCRSDVQMLVH